MKDQDFTRGRIMSTTIRRRPLSARVRVLTRTVGRRRVYVLVDREKEDLAQTARSMAWELTSEVRH